MTAKTCRDCGNVLELKARGCPRCALNFEAENMIDRFFWRRLVPGLVLLVLALIALIYWLVGLRG
jgi:predicted amidophosphoribosyltransferase